MSYPTLSFHTLGCRLNQSESGTLARAFGAIGWSVIDDPTRSDVCIINTCSVTAAAESECRYWVRKILRHSPATFIVVTGCYAQVGASTLQQIPGIDLIAGTEHKMSLPSLLEPLGKSPLSKLQNPILFHTPKISRDDFTLPVIGPTTFEKMTRPHIKIQEGCDFLCTFCIIPFTRGRERSRKWDNVVLEASLWAAHGYKEIVLTGVNLGEYASEGYTLSELIEQLESVSGLHRIRISSIEPTTVSPRLFELMRYGKLTPYLHLPLQSGSNAVLSNMHRRYTREDYIGFVEEAFRSVPDLCLGTDVMVGFPGEGEDEFNETVALIESLPFAYLHVFPFSERKGTRVTRMGLSHVPSSVIASRSRLLRDLSKKKKEAYDQRAIGQTVNVLFEQRNKAGLWEGLTGNYIRVAITSEENLAGALRSVRVETVAEGWAHGRLCST